MSWQEHGPDLALPGAGDTVTLASDGDRDAAVQIDPGRGAARRRARAAQRHALTATGPPAAGGGGAAARAGVGWRAEDR